MCLLEWFRREHSWDHLLRLLSQLGQDSRWGKAMYDDPEMAREMAQKAIDSPGGKWKPDNADWSLVNEQLAQLIDLTTKHMTMISSTPRRIVDPFPRPSTEYARLLDAMREEQSNSAMARIYDLVELGQQRWREGHRPRESDDV